MKKIISLLLTITIVLSFVGCSKPAEKESSEKQESESVQEKEFSMGQVSGNVYENEFIGIGCELNENWTYYDEKQMLELNNIVGDVIDEDVAEQLKNADVIMDMYALDNIQGSTISVNLKKVGKEYNEATDFKSSFENTAPLLENSFASMGSENFDYEFTTIKIGEKEFDAASITVTISGIQLYEMMFDIECGDYTTNITIAAINQELLQEIIDCFYIVE